MIQAQHSASNGLAKPPPAPPRPSPGLGPALLDVCNGFRSRVTAFLEEKTGDKMLRGVQEQVRTSMGVIEEALSRYEPEELSLSYNGGKDCLVMLVLILACLPVWAKASGRSGTNGDASSKPNRTAMANEATAFPETLQAVYIVSTQPFPEVEDFVEATAQEYRLDLSRHSMPMKEALEAYLEERKTVRMVFVGTRRTDPHGEFLTHFDPTDHGWPQFMRVHPVIDWHYAEVWAFIRHLNVPYCALYDRGFTSLGNMSDTHRNPALALDKGRTEFRPAYELMDDEEERLGRYS